MRARTRLVLLASFGLAALLWSRPAEASVQLGLGADYWFDPEVGALQLTLAADTYLARHATIGARFGAVVTSDPSGTSDVGEVGVPIDLRLRIRGRRLYFDGLVGPWIFFEGDAFRIHAGLGFGLLSGSMSFGLEVGWVDPTPIAGIRLAFRL
ncbi:MAG TPA: hypothetical protein VLS93_12675 [Anaeromyxobacteraceae bacterium]|nr:hypothetical protein [Anaeromyxobacteraceae bacterium]